MTRSNRQIFSVSELNRDAKRMLESEFPSIFVEGEISNFMRSGPGHWYFTLKDEKAQLRCAMFRNRNHMVRFKPENGKQIIVKGRISLYEGRGEFQLIADFLEESGEGALRQAFDNLRKQLQSEGLFDEARKKPLPEIPNRIAIITSPRGAAIHDVITVMQRRFPSVHITVVPTMVQGDESVPQIVSAIERANQQSFDLILLTRGGGSLEDLWSFNTEPVARAMAASQIPIVSAVGHESDVTIADFVADLRAPTPSAAAEIITPDQRVWLDMVSNLHSRLLGAQAGYLADADQSLTYLQKRLRHPRQRLGELTQRLDDLERRLHAEGTRQFEQYRFDDLLQRLRLGMQSQLRRATSSLAQAKLTPPLEKIATTREAIRRQSSRQQHAINSHQQQLSARFAEITAKLNTLSNALQP